MAGDALEIRALEPFGHAVKLASASLTDAQVEQLRATPLPDEGFIGPWRPAGICNAFAVVQHEASGPFQEATFGFVVRQVDAAGFLESQLPGCCLDQIVVPFAPPVGRVHGIKHHGPVGVEAHPVVGKDGIRFRREGRGATLDRGKQISHHASRS